jgi:hypothetical protein
VSGTHRGKPDNSVLIALLAVVVIPLAVIGLIIYVASRHPSVIFILVSVLDGVVVIQATHRVVLNLAERPQSAEQLARRLSLLAQLLGAAVVALAAIGQLRGWMHGMFRDVIATVLVLYAIASPVYWFGGKRRLIGMLSARTAGNEPGS